MASQKYSMTLTELLHGVVIDEKFNHVVIEGLELDSRKVQPKQLFIALNGDTVNGIDFINHAIEKGVAAVLWEADATTSSININWRKNTESIDVPIIAVKNLSKLIGEFADRFYAMPSKDISVCGITGTNGKTSCADFIAQVMSIDAPCGLLGTLGQGIYPALKETGFTTPYAIACHQWLAEIKAQQAMFAVMEVSSHALVQGRVNGIRFDSAVFTNLSHEHLDFHGNMESYAAAKMKLFKTAGLKNAIINIDDEAGKNIVGALDKNVRCIRYAVNSQSDADVYATDIKLDHTGLSMNVVTPWGEGKVSAAVIGDFNASNLLAVLSVMLLQGIEFEEALKRISTIKSVSGRMQRFGGNNNPLVVVDFAHTPDALEQALISLRQHTENNLWCVFGCGGDRDKEKRPLMGTIAEQNADFVVLTDDNPRSENATNIINDIKSGINNKNVTIEQDRHAAIHYAISQAEVGDVVLVAGKGHENYQLIGATKYPFNDAEEVMQQLGRRVG